MLSTPDSMSWRHWWLGVRPATLGMSLVPVFLGTALALYQGARLDLLSLLLAIGCVLCIQAGTNLYNDLGEFAQHLYYDGPPDGPPVPNRLHHLCQSIADAKTGGVTPERTGFWITEHARWPEGGGEGWNKNWRLSADLGAAISVADLLIASTQLPQVKGSGLHALHGTTGPWPMFHLPEGATTYHPSVPMHTYALLRETLLPQVLHTRNTSANPARYDGDYSARGTVMRSEDGRRYSVWSINRHGHPLDVELNIPALAGKQLKASLASIDGGADTVNNYDRQVVTGPTRQPVDLRFDDKGVARYVVPAHSVSGLSLALPAK